MNDSQMRFSPAAVNDHVDMNAEYREIFEVENPFSVSEMFKTGFDHFQNHAATLLLATFLFGVISYIVSMVFQLPIQFGLIALTEKIDSPFTDYFFTFFNWFAVSVPKEAFLDGLLLEGMSLSLALQIVGGKKVEFNDAFNHFKKAPSLFLVNFGAAFLAGFASLLFVIPGLVLMALFSWAAILVLDRDETPINALKISARAIWTNKASVIPLLLVTFALDLATSFSCGLGALIATPVAALMMVLSYKHVFGIDAHQMPLDETAA